MAQLSPYRTCNVYTQVEIDSGKVECTYSVGKINKIVVQRLDFDSNLSSVQVFMDNETYTWHTNHMYLVGYMMYGIPVSQDGCYVFAQQDMRGLYCLDAKTGNVIWKTKSKAEISHVLVLERHLCCSKSYDEIQLVDIKTGNVIKTYRTPFDNRFEALTDDYILNHTRSKLWEVISSHTLEVDQSFMDKEFRSKRRSVEQFYKPKIPTDDYCAFEKWLNKHFALDIPQEVKVIIFHLYEDDSHEFDVVCLGLPTYAPGSSKQVYDEVLLTDDDLFHLKTDGCESCLQIVINYVKEYLSSGAYASKLASIVAVTVGFVDGDLEIVFQK